MFEGLTDAKISRLLKAAREEAIPAGTILMAEGEPANKLYILKKGEVEIRKEINERTESLNTIRKGDFFGELTALDGKKNSVSVVATRNCEVLSFERSVVSGMIEKYPQISWNIAKGLSRRLRASNDALKNQIEIQRVVNQKEISRLSSVVQATQTVNSSLRLDRVLELILQEAMRITDAERGTIYLIDENTSEIWARVIAGNEISEIRQPLGKGISGYVAQTGETVNITRAYEDKRFNPEFDKRSGFKTKNVLCMPMRNRVDKIIGVFQLINKSHGSFDFDREDENFLKAFSVNAAIAVENSKLAEQMVQTERLSAVGRMAGTIVHDIKNPMSTIRLYAQVLKKKAGNEEAAGLVDQIIKQIDRLVNMAQEVLDFSRGVTQLKIQPVDFDQFLSSVLPLLEKDFERKNIELRTDLRYTGKIEIDADKMTRVILNIGGNAADAMPNGGTFTVSTHSDGDSLSIELKDTGTGMPEEVKRRIFEPFVTYGKKTGTGLGMAIVKKIMDDLHGTIDIQTELGKGTTMKLCLPLTQERHTA